jgi:hypothetical protein
MEESKGLMGTGGRKWQFQRPFFCHRRKHGIVSKYSCSQPPHKLSSHKFSRMMKCRWRVGNHVAQAENLLVSFLQRVDERLPRSPQAEPILPVEVFRQALNASLPFHSPCFCHVSEKRLSQDETSASQNSLY